MKKPVGRWMVAAAVTMVVFGLTVWVCGALLLPLMVGDDGNRWVIATAAGVVLGGVVGLWGKVYATAQHEKPTPSVSQAVVAAGPRSAAVGGDFTGEISTGSGQNSKSAVQTRPRCASDSGDQPPVRPVRAEGDRSVAIGGSASGVIVTGDQRVAECE